MKQLMTGNEAIARGAYEAGVKYASAYPGTPSTEILENIALYKGASAVAEQEYRNRRTSIHDVAKTKEQEFAANQDFALLRSTINDQLLTLEIISHTPILTIQGEKDVQETTIQEQEENKRQSKKKDKKE